MQETTRQRIIALIEWTLIAAGLCVFFWLLRHSIEYDDGIRTRDLQMLLETGRAPGSPYSMLGSLFATPFYYLGKLYQDPKWWLARWNVVLLGLGLLWMGRLLRAQLGAVLARRFALVLLGASMFPGHMLHWGAEVLTALTAGIGMMLVCLRPSAWGWSVVVLGAVNTPAALIGMGVAVLVQAVHERRWRHLLFVVAAAALVMAESWIRRGHPLRSGYEGNAGMRTALPYSGLPGFSYPFFHGLLSLLLSFGKGIVFFAPGLLLPVRGALKNLGAPAWRLYVLLLAFGIGLLVVYAKWWSWYGGWTWGPRFFLVASIPASLAIAVRLQTPGSSWGRMWLLLVLTLSAWVGANGAVFESANQNLCERGGYQLEAFCWYVPEMSVLWRPFTVAAPLTAQNKAVLAYFAVIYLYLAAPLGWTLVRDAWAAGRRLAPEVLHPRRWRF